RTKTISSDTYSIQIAFAIKRYSNHHIAANIENTGDIENIMETSTNSDISDTIETAIDTEELSIVIDDSSAVLAGNTTYVDDDADSSWYNATQVKTIQEGVANSTAGDTVYVYNGTYYENVEVDATILIVV
ncbi:unnamed protein product, partial [marine sediment metagenome]